MRSFWLLLPASLVDSLPFPATLAANPIPSRPRLPARLLALVAALLLAACQSADLKKASFEIPTLAHAEARAESDPRYAGIVVDTTTGAILYSKDDQKLRHPASLAKMMTLYLLFEDIQAGRLSMGTALTVSEHAARQPPSKLGVKAGSRITVRDAIIAVAVKSANDVAVVVAEGVAGSEDAFVGRMNAKARALGLTQTTFRNASGLPDDRMVTTARDMAILARALQTDFPSRYGVFSTREFKYKGKTYRSTNRLLGVIPGVDGMKTGYIRAAGYNLVASVKRGGKRIIIVVMGEKSGSARNGHVAALADAYLPAGGGVFAAR